MLCAAAVCVKIMAIMRSVLPENLISLARVSPAPLYVVGGAVRDFAAGLSPSKRDWDICAPCSVSDMSRAAADCGFGISFSNAATGSLKLKRGDTVCEFTSFRTDVYGGKGHAPSAVKFTADIAADARRRDFTCNAVYYDICGGQFADPLGGLRDIAAGRLVPCAPADRLFAEDALRVLRLARFCGELGFDADDDCFAAAASAADGLRFLSPATVWREVCGIVRADEKYNMAGGAARALSVMRKTGALAAVFPSLAAPGGETLSRAVWAASAAPPGLRVAALLFALGPEGIEEQLARYPAGAAFAADCALLAKLASFRGEGGELRAFLQRNADRAEDLVALRRAAVGDEKAEEWSAVLERMRAEGVPMSLSQLAVRGDELIAAGVPAAMTGKTLRFLLSACALKASLNRRGELIRLALKFCRGK